MLIYTGYFAKIREYESKNLLPISISLSKKIAVPFRIDELAPTWEMINRIKETGDEAEYINSYNKILDKVDKKKLLINISTMVKDLNRSNAVLLCYESPDDFCHRKLVKEWINENHSEFYGVQCVEYGHIGIRDAINAFKDRIFKNEYGLVYPSDIKYLINFYIQGCKSRRIYPLIDALKSDEIYNDSIDYALNSSIEFYKININGQQSIIK